MGNHMREKEDEEVKIPQNTLVMNRIPLIDNQHSTKNSGVPNFKNIQSFESENKIKNMLI